MRFNKSGFTLIELIIVIVIIGILASIAAPMMSGMKARAICAEAVTGLSALRTAIRAYYTEYGSYPLTTSGGYVNAIVADGHADYFPGLTLTSGTTYGGSGLDGTYFSQSCYYYGLAQPGGDPPDTYYAYCGAGGGGSGVGNLSPNHTDTEKTGLIQMEMRFDNGRLFIGDDKGWRPYS